MKTDLFRPYSWSCEAGVLSIVAPVAESVVDFRKDGNAVVRGSVSTPSGGVLAKVLTEAQFLAGEDAAGTMVMLEPETHPSRERLTAIIDCGALGFISDFTPAKMISDDWRIGRDLIELYEAYGNLEKMLAVATDYLGRYPLKNPIQIAYARSLAKLGRHREAMAFLEGVKILPSEHRDSATEIWHDCQKAMGLPLTWPENLGRGEPYHDGEWRQKG